MITLQVLTMSIYDICDALSILAGFLIILCIVVRFLERHPAEISLATHRAMPVPQTMLVSNAPRWALSLMSDGDLISRSSAGGGEEKVRLRKDDLWMLTDSLLIGSFVASTIHQDMLQEAVPHKRSSHVWATTSKTPGTFTFRILLFPRANLVPIRLCKIAQSCSNASIHLNSQSFARSREAIPQHSHKASCNLRARNPPPAISLRWNSTPSST
jgi:hypothetical protein